MQVVPTPAGMGWAVFYNYPLNGEMIHALLVLVPTKEIAEATISLYRSGTPEATTLLKLIESLPAENATRKKM